MGEHVIKLPDVGEGVAEAELVEWHVKVGDLVREDALLAAVMTDKATVEIPSPVDGEILWLGAEIGETVAVGSPIVRLKVAGEGNAAAAHGRKSRATSRSPKPAAAEAKQRAPAEKRRQGRRSPPPKPAPAAPTKVAARQRTPLGAPRAEGEKPLASPAVRLRASEAGVDLRQVAGSRSGRPHHARGYRGLPGAWAAGREGDRACAATTAVEDIKVVGLRRKIAEKMALAKSRIPHITYVEEVDVTALEELRAALNKEKRAGPGPS